MKTYSETSTMLGTSIPHYAVAGFVTHAVDQAVLREGVRDLDIQSVHLTVERKADNPDNVAHMKIITNITYKEPS